MAECILCGEDHGKLSHAQVAGTVRVEAVQMDCPVCECQNCTALLMVDLYGDARHVSWCENGHVAVGNVLDHMLVYKFM